MTEREWKEALAFFHFRCAWCGAWSNKLYKDEVARVFPWTDFGRNEDWTGIVVPACERCAELVVSSISNVARYRSSGHWIAKPNCLVLIEEWLEMNRGRYIYES